MAEATVHADMCSYTPINVYTSIQMLVCTDMCTHIHAHIFSYRCMMANFIHYRVTWDDKSQVRNDLGQAGPGVWL